MSRPGDNLKSPSLRPRFLPAASRTQVGARGFTLVELLVVVALIIMTAAVTVPAFSALVQGTGTRAAAAQVRGALSQARSHAVMNNTVVDFIVMTQGQKAGERIPFDAGQMLERANDYLSTGFALYDRGNNKYVKAWTRLPDGVVFDPRETDFKDSAGRDANFLNPVNVSATAPAATAASTLRYRVPLIGNSPRYCPAIRFRPSGRVTCPVHINNSTMDRSVVVMAEGSTRFNVDTAGVISAMTGAAAGTEVLITPSALKSAVFIYHYSGRTEVQYK